MGITNRKFPLYFFPVTSEKYRNNYDEIFRKKKQEEVVENTTSNQQAEQDDNGSAKNEDVSS